MNDNTDRHRAAILRKRQAVYDRNLAYAKMCDSWALAFGLAALLSVFAISVTASGYLVAAGLATAYLQLQDVARTHKSYAKVELLGDEYADPAMPPGPALWQRALCLVPGLCFIGAFLLA